LSVLRFGADPSPRDFPSWIFSSFSPPFCCFSFSLSFQPHLAICLPPLRAALLCDSSPVISPLLSTVCNGKPTVVKWSGTLLKINALVQIYVKSSVRVVKGVFVVVEPIRQTSPFWHFPSVGVDYVQRSCQFLIIFIT